jgi:hypothetical protein
MVEENRAAGHLTLVNRRGNNDNNTRMSGDDGERIVHILGIGLDNKDGHTRLTQAEQFTVAGGSEETHGRITETLIKTCENLERRGKSLESADVREIAELIDKNTPRG